MSHTDLTFITNEEEKNLKLRFQALIKDTKLFDCLVGYFYTSGFNAIYKSLENTEKIRILIGISTSKQTYELLTEARNDQQQALQFSHAETKQAYEGLVEKEMEESEDKYEVEEGVAKFIEWIGDDCPEPSRSEDLSLLLLQALACECTIVSTTAAHIIEHETNGLISPIEDWKTLANNLNTVLDNDELRLKLQKNARLLSEKYSLEKSCEKFLDTLNILIKNES